MQYMHGPKTQTGERKVRIQYTCGPDTETRNFTLIDLGVIQAKNTESYCTVYIN